MKIYCVLGIAIGVAAMIVVLNVINGFDTELRNRFLSANAHILAYRFPSGLIDHKEWQSKIKNDFPNDLSGVAPFIHADTMGRKDYIVHRLLVRGISPQQRQSVQKLSHIVRPSESLQELQKEIDAFESGKSIPEIPSIIIGAGLAQVMNAKINDTIELISPNATEKTKINEMQQFRVIGIYDSGLQHYDNKLGILSIPAAQRLFGMGNRVTGIEIGLIDPNDSPTIASSMQEKYSLLAGRQSLSIKEWQSYNKNIFEAMQNEKTIIGFIVALVVFVASFNILTTLFISVTQKRREIAILKALGASNKQIIFLFVQQSIFIGGIGGSLGCGVALALSWLLDQFHFINLPEIYLLASLPISYDSNVYIYVAISGIFIATIAGIFPAWSATRVSPTEGLREARQK